GIMVVSRRQLVLTLFGGVVGSLLAACQAPAPASQQAPATAPTAANPLVKPRATGADLTAVQASTELAQGRNRFALGLIDSRNQPVATGNVRVELFKVSPSGTAEKRAEDAAVFRSVGGASKGIWVTPATFNDTGAWGAQVTLDA